MLLLLWLSSLVVLRWSGGRCNGCRRCRGGSSGLVLNGTFRRLLESHGCRSSRDSGGCLLSGRSHGLSCRCLLSLRTGDWCCPGLR